MKKEHKLGAYTVPPPPHPPSGSYNWVVKFETLKMSMWTDKRTNKNKCTMLSNLVIFCTSLKILYQLDQIIIYITDTLNTFWLSYIGIEDILMTKMVHW